MADSTNEGAQPLEKEFRKITNRRRKNIKQLFGKLGN